MRPPNQPWRAPIPRRAKLYSLIALLVAGCIGALVAFIVAPEKQLESKLTGVGFAGPCRHALQGALETHGLSSDQPGDLLHALDFYATHLHSSAPQADAVRAMTMDTQCREQVLAIAITCNGNALCLHVFANPGLGKVVVPKPNQGPQLHREDRCRCGRSSRLLAAALPAPATARPRHPAR